MTDNFQAEYLEETARRFRQQKQLAEAAMAQLEDEELFRTPDQESNSVAVIVKHMSGNLRSRFTGFLTADGEKPDRQRDQEFVIGPDTPREQVMGWWEEGWGCLFAALDALRPEDLGRPVFIRGERHSVLQALQRQLTHHAHHAGQIVFLARHWKAAQWKPLSIPRGQSAAFTARKRGQHKHRE